MDLPALRKHKPAHTEGEHRTSRQAIYTFKGSRFDLDLDFFRFCLFFFGQGDLQDSLAHLGSDFSRINLVVDSKAPGKTLFAEFADAIIVFIALRALLPIAFESQYAVMELNRNVFLGHARGFCFQMKRIVLFNHIYLW